MMQQQYTDATSRIKVHLVLQLSWEPCILLRKLFLKLSGKGICHKQLMYFLFWKED